MSESFHKRSPLIDPQQSQRADWVLGGTSKSGLSAFSLASSFAARGGNQAAEAARAPMKKLTLAING